MSFESTGTAKAFTAVDGGKAGFNSNFHEMAKKNLIQLVMRDNGSNNWQEWLEVWKIVGPLMFPRDKMYEAITEGTQWTDPKWLVLRAMIPDDAEFKKLVYRDERDAQLVANNVQMLNYLILSVDKSVILKAKSQHAEEYKAAVDADRPDLLVKIIKKTVLLRHVDDGNNQLAAEARLHSITHRSREPSLHAKLYMEFAEVYLETLSEAAKAAWLLDPVESKRYVKTLGPEFHEWLKLYKIPPLSTAGIREVISASLVWYREQSDDRKISGMKPLASKVSERSVAFVAESASNPKQKASSNSQFKGKLNNGGAADGHRSEGRQIGKAEPCAYCLLMFKVEKFHACKDCFALQNASKNKNATAPTRPASPAPRDGRRVSFGTSRGGRGSGGRKNGRGRGSAKMAYSDGIAFIARPVAVDDEDMPELLDDVESSSDDSDFDDNAALNSDYFDPPASSLASQMPSLAEVEQMPSLAKVVPSDSDSDSETATSYRVQQDAIFHLDSGANCNCHDSIEDSSENLDPGHAVDVPIVRDIHGNPVQWQPFYGKINLYELDGPYNADAAYVKEGIRDMAEAHSEVYMLSQLRSFLEHVGYPRRLSYDPTIQPDFIVDVKDEDNVGQIFMAKRPHSRYCGNSNCGREMRENSIYCSVCTWVDEDFEAQQIAAERAEEEALENAQNESLSRVVKTPGKKRLTEAESLAESSMLGQSLNDYWYCTVCSHPSPMDYDFCGNCAGDNRGVRKSVQRSSKPPPGSLRETSKMGRVDRYSPPTINARRKTKVTAVIEKAPSPPSSEPDDSDSGNRSESVGHESDVPSLPPPNNELWRVQDDDDYHGPDILGFNSHRIRPEHVDRDNHLARYVSSKQTFQKSHRSKDFSEANLPKRLPLTITGRDKIAESLDALYLAINHHSCLPHDLDGNFRRECRKAYKMFQNFLVSYEFRKGVELGSYNNLGPAFHQVRDLNAREQQWSNDYLHEYNGPHNHPFVKTRAEDQRYNVEYSEELTRFIQVRSGDSRSRDVVVLGRYIGINANNDVVHVTDKYAPHATVDIHNQDEYSLHVPPRSMLVQNPVTVNQTYHDPDNERVDQVPRDEHATGSVRIQSDHPGYGVYTDDEASDDGLVRMIKVKRNGSPKRREYGDSAASDNIGSLKDKELYTNVRRLKTPKRFNGVGKGSIVCYFIGDRGGVKDVYLSKDIDESLFSFASLWEQGFHGVIDNESQTLTFQKSDSIVVFKLIDRMLVLTSLDGTDANPDADGSVFTAEDLQPSKYSKRQKQRADAYWTWHKGTGHNGDTVETSLLQATPLHHCDVTAQDKVIALEINGPCAACMAGKATSPKSLPIVLQMRYNVGECQYVDIMIVRLSSGQFRIKFVFVDSACLKVVIVHATSKTTVEYANALAKVSGYYKSRGFQPVRVTYSDNEPCIHGYAEAFLRQGGQARFVAAGEHVVIVERAISTVKKMCRTMLLSLVYPLPERLINYLIDEVVSLMSLRPTEGTNGVPLLVFIEGRYPDYRRLQVEWGSYVLATVPVDRRNHDFAATAEPALLLRRPLCGEPNFTCMLLKNNELVQRRSIKKMPMPAEIIDEFRATTSVVPTLSFHDAPIRGVSVAAGASGVASSDHSALLQPRDTEIVSMLEAEEEVRDQVNAQFQQASDTVVDLTGDVYNESATTVENTEGAPAQTEAVPAAPVVPVVPNVPFAPVGLPRMSKAAKAKLKVAQIISEVRELQPGQAKVAHDLSRREYNAVRILQRREFKAEGVLARRKLAVDKEARSFRDIIVGTALMSSDFDLKTEPHTSKFSKPAKSGNMSFRAAKGKHDEVADTAGMKEVAQILEKDIFEPVFWNDLSPEMQAKAIRSFTFFKEKFKVSGALEKLKARLVAGGNLVASEELGDISSPTAKLETLFLLHSLAAQFGWMLSVMDVPGAYLNTVLPESERIPMILGKEEVVVALRLKPEWKKYVRADGTMAVMLKGGLYGMPQAAKLWNEMIANTLIEEGYQQADGDSCLFVKFHPSGKKSIVLLYVDDLAHFYEEKSMQDSLLKGLSRRYGDLTAEHGDTGIYIGVEYSYNRADKSVKLTMNKYVDKLLRDFNVQKGASTPVAADFMDRDADSPRVDSKVFASGVMSLYYLALRVRKDLLFPITVLSMRIQDCREDDVSKLVRLYSYLYATRGQGVVLRTRGVTLVYSIDASYAIHENARSHTGFYVTLGDGGPPPPGFGGPIHCKSVVQKLVTLSSFEAELNAIHQCVQYFYDFRVIMSDLGYDQVEPSILLQDNMATIQVVTNGPSAQSRSRHVNVRIFNVKQMVDWGMLSVVYQSTEDMLADVLTKPFSSRACLGLLQRLLNWFN